MERKENRLILFLDAISNSFQISCHFLLTCLLAARESSEACYLKYREGSVIDIESWREMVILIKFKCKTARNDLHITLEKVYHEEQSQFRCNIWSFRIPSRRKFFLSRPFSTYYSKHSLLEKRMDKKFDLALVSKIGKRKNFHESFQSTFPRLKRCRLIIYMANTGVIVLIMKYTSCRFKEHVR